MTIDRQNGVRFLSQQNLEQLNTIHEDYVNRLRDASGSVDKSVNELSLVFES